MIYAIKFQTAAFSNIFHVCVRTTGHIGAALELADQIRNGILSQPSHIFLPLGSSCTTAGLLAGIAVARKLALGFEKPLKVHAVIIHHAAALFPSAVEWAVGKLARDTLGLVYSLGGPDASGELEDVLSECLVLHNSYAGKYGAWTDKGKAAVEVFANSSHEQSGNESAFRELWLCSCFSSKAAACMLDFLSRTSLRQSESVLFWSTKSLVQPVGRDGVPWAKVSTLPSRARAWLEQGDISADREGDIKDHNMTPLPASK